MIIAILEALWFFVPAGVANMSPVLAAKIPALDALDIPIDGGKTFRGKRIFGDHKTVRGFMSGYIGALLTFAAQVIAYRNLEWVREISLFDYSTINILVWAFVFSMGALGGDAIKSFFKRQFDVPSGKSWFPFDQLDYIIGGLLASMLLIQLEFMQYVAIAIIWFLIHPLATFIGWLLRLKDSPI